VEAAVVQAMLRGSRDALDDELPMGGSRYACDTPFFVNEAKAPALVFGPGSIDQAHTYDEWVEIEQLVKATKVYAAGALRFLGHE
jgi:acetylornithine deacetylase/succinyl-diaminopimelate desuccinylase-like protein